jgi:hypothetical protein
MGKPAYIASFIGHQPGEALFVGLFEIVGPPRVVTPEEFWAMPLMAELRNVYGMLGYKPGIPRPTRLLFDLRLTGFRTEEGSRLIVRWPPQERSWVRRMERNHFDLLTPQSLPPVDNVSAS